MHIPEFFGSRLLDKVVGKDERRQARRIIERLRQSLFQNEKKSLYEPLDLSTDNISVAIAEFESLYFSVYDFLTINGFLKPKIKTKLEQLGWSEDSVKLLGTSLEIYRNCIENVSSQEMLPEGGKKLLFKMESDRLEACLLNDESPEEILMVLYLPKTNYFMGIGRSEINGFITILHNKDLEFQMTFILVPDSSISTIDPSLLKFPAQIQRNIIHMPKIIQLDEPFIKYRREKPMDSKNKYLAPLGKVFVNGVKCTLFADYPRGLPGETSRKNNARFSQKAVLQGV